MFIFSISVYSDTESYSSFQLDACIQTKNKQSAEVFLFVFGIRTQCIYTKMIVTNALFSEYDGVQLGLWEPGMLVIFNMERIPAACY